MKLWLIASAVAVGLVACTAQAQYAPPPPPGWNFWQNAPRTPRERLDYLENRVNGDYDRGRISDHDARQAKQELRDLRSQMRTMHYWDGGRLNPRDDAYVQHRLDQISREVHWDARH